MLLIIKKNHILYFLKGSEICHKIQQLNLIKLWKVLK